MLPRQPARVRATSWESRHYHLTPTTPERGSQGTRGLAKRAVSGKQLLAVARPSEDRQIARSDVVNASLQRLGSCGRDGLHKFPQTKWPQNKSLRRVRGQKAPHRTDRPLIEALGRGTGTTRVPHTGQAQRSTAQHGGRGEGQEITYLRSGAYPYLPN